MRAEKKQTNKVACAFFKCVNSNHRIFKHHEQFRQADNSHSCKKVLNKLKCSDDEDKYTSDSKNLIFQSTDTTDIKELHPVSVEAQKHSDIWKYDVLISRNNAIQQRTHSSWKYKNPYSISISNCTRDEKFSYESENILKNDEPQEGRTRRSVLSDCREYLTNRQESYVIPRTKYSFAALMIIMAQATVQSLWVLLHMFVNIAPVIQIFSFILRFILDKIIDIRRTKNLKQIIVKFIILTAQLLSIYVCLIFMLNFIFFPIVQMAVGIAAKFVMHD